MYHTIQYCIHYIRDHLDEDLTIAHLARRTGLSIWYLSRTFKEVTGIAFREYVILCRIERAHTLLHEDRLTLSQIAHQVGFYDQSHLNRHFKRIKGVTPSQYKKGVKI